MVLRRARRRLNHRFAKEVVDHVASIGQGRVHKLSRIVQIECCPVTLCCYEIRRTILPEDVEAGNGNGRILREPIY